MVTEYTVHKLGQMAGVSTRTLRYYDELGILKPARINSSGYRIYGQSEVDRLQQVLFYRELGFSLERIKEIVTSTTFDATEALGQHRQQLLERRRQLDVLIANVEQTLSAAPGGNGMTDQEKFYGFKRRMIEDNERTYGEEIRAKYGQKRVESSNRKMKDMTKEQYEAVEQLGQQIFETLEEAVKTSDPAGELGQRTAALHREWLCFYWDSYSKEAHARLANMYVADERYTAYYDKIQPGATAFLRDAIRIYTHSIQE